MGTFSAYRVLLENQAFQKSRCHLCDNISIFFLKMNFLDDLWLVVKDVEMDEALNLLMNSLITPTYKSY